MKWTDSNKSVMGGKTPRRRSSWTKHTSYPTLQNEESIHIPAEISASTRANIRCAEKRLKVSTKRLDNIQRKSLNQLDAQRKLLEKSMLAYSEKMKDISSSRTNEVFREIRTRDSTRDDRVIKSPTASVRSNFSLPAKLITKLHKDCRSLKGFHQVNICSPIAERSTDCSPIPRSRSAPRRYNFSSAESDKTHDKLLKKTSSSPKSLKKETGSVICTVNVESENGTTDVISNTKVYPRVATGSIPWLRNDLSDSAYSSASEDFDRDNSDIASETSERSNKTVGKEIDPAKQNILTVPVVHIRRNTRKNRKRGRTSSNSPRKQSDLVNAESRICSHT